MTTTVAEILGRIAELTPAEQVELRRAIDSRSMDEIEAVPALHDGDLRFAADTWDKLGPAPDFDHDSGATWEKVESAFASAAANGLTPIEG
jgi:hypothetical protein